MKLSYTLILKIEINFKSFTSFCSTIDVRKLKLREREIEREIKREIKRDKER